MLSPAEIRKNAIAFEREHAEDRDEKSQAQNFWRDFFAIFGLSPQRIGVFEARARTLKGTVGFIDFFWPGTLLVEHKSRDKDLEAALKQALDYCAGGGLSESELPRYIVVCDFARFVMVELASGDRAEFRLESLHENLHRFNFILGYEQKTYRDEDPVNIAAAELMGALHDDLRRVGFEGHPLELFLVRLMFCFFADDTGIFQKDQFGDWLETRTRPDGSDLGQSIAEVFRTLNTDPEKRQKNLPEELAAFPYVNGELFAEAAELPYFDAKSRAVLLHAARFNWGSVSPAIFGSLFQSVMEAGERRALGAHYTSEKNILKTIHGLFLDELHADFASAGAKRSERGLKALLERIAAIRILDPACGCGNFLILAYRELRRLEIEIHKELRRLSGDTGRSLDLGLERGITVDHIYGIEIAEFPAQIARVALWIMDHLMNVELATTLGDYRPSIPLRTSPRIVQGNALRLDWKEIVRPEELSYILGNPPFVGAKWMNDAQREDIARSLGQVPNSGLIDYVGAWYVRAEEYIRGTKIQCAFVSTNSITQGEQVGALWGWLMPRGVRINFAHRTFKWSNEARGNAAVHCVIIGFALFDRASKLIYDYETVTSEAIARPAVNINPYLADARDVWIGRRSRPLCAVPEMVSGNQPIDDGNYLFTPEGKADFLRCEPEASPLFKRWLGGAEFLNNIERWCLFVADTPPQELKRLPETLKRVEAVRKYRKLSSRVSTKKLADTPTQFQVSFAADKPYVAMPEVSSERRDYIPVAYLGPEVLCGNKLRLIRDASLFHFGVLTSRMHMAWTRHTCGRLESRYQYSVVIVYNNYPWPARGVVVELPPERVAAVESAAQAVLDARAAFPKASLADLYDPLTMPPALAKAHKTLDLAVDKCYRKEPFKNELERVEYLFGLYEDYSSQSSRAREET